MEIAALPVPVFPFGGMPEAKGNAQDAARQQDRGAAIGLPASGRSNGVPDEVVLQGEILGKNQRNSQDTYSKPKNSGVDLQGEAYRERHRNYTPAPGDSYTLRTAINAYQENAQPAAVTLRDTEHMIDVFV